MIARSGTFVGSKTRYRRHVEDALKALGRSMPSGWHATPGGHAKGVVSNTRYRHEARGYRVPAGRKS